MHPRTALVTSVAAVAFLLNCSSGAANTGAVSSAGGGRAGTAAELAGATAGAGAPVASGSAGTRTGSGGAGSSAGSGSDGLGGAGRPSAGASGRAAAGSAEMSNGAGASPSGGAAGGSGMPAVSAGSDAAFKITSPALADGAKFGDKYTCVAMGFQKSTLPELEWTEGPSGTKSYAITLIDVSLTRGMVQGGNADLGYHWVIYNIPAAVHRLTEGLTDAQVKALPAAENSAYLGPCPNFGSASGATSPRTDSYEFTIYALASDKLTLTGTGTAMVKDANTKLEANNLAKAKLTGTSDAYSTR